jgi:hypothetical protein
MREERVEVIIGFGKIRRKQAIKRRMIRRISRRIGK